MQDPLKQGLKQPELGGKTWISSDSNARSTKTRIETFYCDVPSIRKRNSNARSTKTRIETIRYSCGRSVNHIRMQDPLKQGLKL